MNTVLRKSGIAFSVATLMAALAGGVFAADMKVKLSGDQEVPSVKSLATGTGTITVNDDMTLSGSVKTKGIKATSAHIHEGALGQSGGVAVPLEKKGENEWVVPAGAKLTVAQMDAMKAGNLYVNVHSDAFKNGEIRGQLTQ